jgi:hypothetical protein
MLAKIRELMAEVHGEEMVALANSQESYSWICREGEEEYIFELRH